MSATIQPRFGENSYPISRLLLDRAKALRLTRTDLVHRFEYRDLNSGHRALTEFMQTGIIPSFVEKKLAEVLEVDQGFLDAVLLATARQLRDEAGSQMLAREDAHRASFRAHLQVETERRIPSPIFVAALFGTARLRIVPLPDETFSAGEDTRDRVIKATITEHFRASAGCVPAFGSVTGYSAVLMCGYGVDFGLPFDVRGDPVGSMRKVRRLPEATLGTKRGDARLTGLLPRSAASG